MRDDGKLIEAAMRLRGHNAGDWDEFVMQLRLAAATAAQDMVTATPELIFLAQGRARAYADLAKVLMTAPAVFAKMEQKRKDGAASTDPSTSPQPRAPGRKEASGAGGSGPPSLNWTG